MTRFNRPQLACVIALISGIFGAQCRADTESALQLLRVSGCAGVLPAMQPLQHNVRLDRAAELWASGTSPGTASERSGYPAGRVTALHLRGTDDAILQALRQSRCGVLADQSLREIGVYSSGTQYWVVLATPPSGVLRGATPPRAPASGSMSELAPRVLELVNDVRARGTRCGDRPMGSAPPLRLSETLDRVAYGHAADMARNDYFEHVDLKGRSPADRVRAAGVREKLVGENIAYGPTSADEVVAGWLHSPGHCENIMDPRFVEMGLAQASGQGSRRGLYWDQVLTDPVP